MKSLIKVFGILALASVLSGWGYAYHQAHKIKTETRVFCVKVLSGDTLDMILDAHFNEANEGKSRAEWMWEQKELNKNLRFYADGRPRHLQVGDRVHIVAKVKVTE